MCPWALLAQSSSQSYFLYLKAFLSKEHLGKKEGNFTAALRGSYWCVQVETEKSSTLPFSSSAAACLPLLRRGTLAAPAVAQVLRYSHLPSPSPQRARASPQPAVITGHSGKERTKPSPLLGPLVQDLSPNLAVEHCSHPSPGQPQPAGGGGGGTWARLRGSELSSHAAQSMWWLFPCLLPAGLWPHSVNFVGKCDE